MQQDKSKIFPFKKNCLFERRLIKLENESLNIHKFQMLPSTPINTFFASVYPIFFFIYDKIARILERLSFTHFSQAPYCSFKMTTNQGSKY